MPRLRFGFVVSSLGGRKRAGKLALGQRGGPGFWMPRGPLDPCNSYSRCNRFEIFSDRQRLPQQPLTHFLPGFSISTVLPNSSRLPVSGRSEAGEQRCHRPWCAPLAGMGGSEDGQSRGPCLQGGGWTGVETKGATPSGAVGCKPPGSVSVTGGKVHVQCRVDDGDDGRWGHPGGIVRSPQLLRLQLQLLGRLLRLLWRL